MKSCAVTIPVYKPAFTTQEHANVAASLSNLQGFDIYLFAPENLDIHYYESSFRLNKVVRFPDIYFDSIQGYSRLLLSDLFYESFHAYSHVLICQPDARVLKPELGYWLEQPYDYFGAPWPKGFELTLYPKEINLPEGVLCKTFVGNGGFSLREIKSCLSLFAEFSSVRENWILHGHAEDLFFGLVSMLSKNFRIPNLMLAANFSHETEAEYLYKLIGNQLPFGCHSHEKYELEHWNRVLPKNINKR
jgi:hypothetical protein